MLLSLTFNIFVCLIIVVLYESCILAYCWLMFLQLVFVSDLVVLFGAPRYRIPLLRCGNISALYMIGNMFNGSVFTS